MENLVPDFVKLERIFQENTYKVDARILDGCNFDCIYCSDELKKKQDVKYVSADFLQEFSNFIYQTRNQKLNLNLTGGEPLLHPEFEKIVQTPNVNHLSISTNFSSNLHLLKKYDNFINAITISLHRPYWKKWQSVFKKIEYFDLNPKKIHLTIMYWPGDMQTVMEIKKFWEDNPNKLGQFTLRRIRTKNQWQEADEYSQEDLKFMIDNIKNTNTYHDVKATYESGEEQLLNTNELMTKKLWNFRNWQCGSLQEGCLLVPENLIQNGNCNQIQITFDDFKTFILQQQPLICKRPRCFCTFDLKFTKQRLN